MPPDEVFLRRAAECKRMAEFSRDLQSKATWRRMAERWHRCADIATSVAQHDSKRHRKPAPGWAHH